MTSEEIARIAKVSRSTVSRVLNHYTNVPEATRLKVQKVIDQYGYTPNHSARILAGKTNHIIGVFLADIYPEEHDSKWVGVHSPYNMEVLSHVIQIAKKKGYLTLIDTISHARDYQDMENQFTNRTLCGGIFIGFPYRTKELEDMAKKGYNVVLVDQLSDLDDKQQEIKRVNTDNVLGGYLATQHLIQQGHVKILHVAGDDRLSSYQREKGFKQAMKEAGIKEQPVVVGAFREDVAYKVTKEYVQHHKITAIFSANDIMAVGIIRGVEELGWKIPQDISLVGFDNLEWSHWTDVGLTTMGISKKELANQGVNLLLNQETSRVCVPTLIPRQSVAPPKKTKG